jgi:hypothetical protein
MPVELSESLSPTYSGYEPPHMRTERDEELEMLAQRSAEKFNERSGKWGRGGIVVVGLFLGIAIMNRSAHDAAHMSYSEAIMQGADALQNFDSMGRYKMKQYDDAKPMASFLAGIVACGECQCGPTTSTVDRVLHASEWRTRTTPS